MLMGKKIKTLLVYAAFIFALSELIWRSFYPSLPWTNISALAGVFAFIACFRILGADGTLIKKVSLSFLASFLVFWMIGYPLGDVLNFIASDVSVEKHQFLDIARSYKSQKCVKTVIDDTDVCIPEFGLGNPDNQELEFTVRRSWFGFHATLNR